MSIFCIVDGMTEGPEATVPAAMPVLSRLAKEGAGGTFVTTPAGFQADSFVCILTLLGLPKEAIPTGGRAWLEALGAGIAPAAEDLVHSLQEAVPAICLNSQTSLLTALLNDGDPEMIFAQQVYGYGKPGDVLLGFSTSGNSKNVLHAVRVARALGMSSILITGSSGGEIGKLVDTAICVPETETYKVQELTLPVYHALCMLVEQELFGS